MDDILSFGGQQVDGRTSVEFVIPLDSGDPFDKALTAGESYDMLISYQATSDSFDLRHTDRGAGRIDLDPAP